MAWFGQVGSKGMMAQQWPPSLEHRDDAKNYLYYIGLLEDCVSLIVAKKQAPSSNEAGL